MGWQVYAIAIGAPVVIMAVGLGSLVRKRLKEDERKGFAEEFRGQFLDWANSSGQNQQAYNWMILNSHRMQGEMGGYGLYASFKPPFANFAYKNYPIILNMIPELRQHIDRSDGLMRLGNQMIDSYGKAIDETLLRYIGSLEDAARRTLGEVRNPFAWLRSGVELVVSMPLLMLSGFGLFGARTVQLVQGSLAFRLVTALVALAGLASSIVTVLAGWDQTVKIIGPLLGVP